MVFIVLQAYLTRFIAAFILNNINSSSFLGEMQEWIQESLLHGLFWKDNEKKRTLIPTDQGSVHHHMLINVCMDFLPCENPITKIMYIMKNMMKSFFNIW